MRNLEGFKIESVPHHAIVIALTSQPDYEMNRMLLAEDFPGYGDYTVIEGYHCSCYGFEETKWDVTVYTKEELQKVAEGWASTGYGVEPQIAPLILEYIKS